MANYSISTTLSPSVLSTVMIFNISSPTPTLSTSNTSNGTEFPINEEGLDEVYSMPHVVLSSIFMILIIICTLIGNILVILAFRTYHRLRVVTNYFIVSLACADILVALFSMPIWVVNIITQGKLLYDENPPPLYFTFWTASDILSSSASIMHLTVVSIDRYLCITYPFKYHEYMTKTKAKVAICCIWIGSVLISSTLFIQISHPWNCGDCYPLVMTVVVFLMPLSVIMVAYLKIFQIARHQAKSLQLTVAGKTKKFSLSKELRAAKTLGIVIGAFVFCWLPFFLLMFLLYVIPDTIYYLPSITLFIDISKWFHYGNSMLNPIIYSCKNKEFSRAFSDLVIRKCLNRHYERKRSNTSEYTMDTHANYV